MIFYKNKTLRYNDYNYSNNGFYFITICIKDRRHVFGEIENGKMIINNIGIIAKNIWQNLNKNRKNILLHTFVVTPNHIHGIVQVNNINQYNVVPENTSERKNQIIPNLISVYKSLVSKEIKKKYINIDFKWQKSYYDRIIRNDSELMAIENYINSNPSKWERDIENKKSDRTFENYVENDILNLNK